MKRSAFTMIEIMFVIVILGILSTIAIPKLMATRDDAKTSVELQNLATCINDVGSAYSAKGVEISTTVACTRMNCFTLELNDVNDGNFTILTGGEDNGEAYCDFAQNKGIEKGLVATHAYGWSKVSYD